MARLSGEPETQGDRGMALFQLIGIVGLVWIAVSALVVAVAAAAGRADNCDRSLRLTARASLANEIPEVRSARARTRFVRGSQRAAAVAEHQSVPPGVRAAIR
ncbi:hypothetical protein Q5424_08505 [Conexibacter sp. JD483]|uniref:hypothetical protein n=1 Tax=unclassified Conexibacter TaxID=2627773 RepID=UPI00271963BA|nr:MULTISPECIES: hypothetical protein [unclassified Conexibacter]MDO8186138.1 hypothetical protein [Conexibacter sp. CPCC 205706]MDO8199628.1 hypothetical protein [Conexibacter sp. CPCC 205762]MDR9369118.1 hypothetical protein [Conexibacter sp. JD483]